MADLFFEDVEVGSEITAFEKRPTTRQLVMYAGASDDYVTIHYDKDAAIAAGHRTVIVHGALKSAFLGQMLTDWIGPRGRLVALDVSYRGIDYPGDTLTCRGRVLSKRSEGGRNLVECEIRIENGTGQVTTPGRALVSLPSRDRSRDRPSP
jgi:acyl dehydratase